VRRLSSFRDQRVLTHEEMGEWKPSQFLRHLKSLAAEVAPFLTTAFIAQAPDTADVLQKIEDLSR
jgi:hypothetical protein